MNLQNLLVCPKCKGRLERKKTNFYCLHCQIHYPLFGDIVDFRKDLSLQEEYSLKYFRHHTVMVDQPYRLEEWHKSFLARFEDNFSTVKNKIVFDGGVGQGYMTIELAKKGAFVIACDLVMEALLRLKAVAGEKGLENRILLICCTLENLPLKDNMVDFLIMNAVLEHLDNDELAIAETGRVCRRRSGLMITVPLSYRYLNPFFFPFSLWQDRKIGHKRRYDEKKLNHKLLNFNFQVKRAYYSGHFLKVIITKFFTEMFSSGLLAGLAEKLDKKSENKKWGASNLCVLFKRE